MASAQQAVQPPSPAKWQRWLNGLRNEVHTLRLYRTTWRELIKAAEGNPNIPRTHVFGYLATTYSHSQAVAVRRLCGSQRNEISFKNLLREIAANPGLLPNRQVDVAGVAADLKSLDSGTLQHVNRYVSQYLAHAQETATIKIPTFQDLHQAIDDLSELLRKYVLLIENADQLLDPVVLGDWMAPFRMAWLPAWPTRRS